MQHDAGGHRPGAGIHQVWDVTYRPTFFKLGHTIVCGRRTYATVQEEFTTTRSIQERFPAHVLDSVWMVD